MTAAEALDLEARAQAGPAEGDLLLMNAAAIWQADGNLGRSALLLRAVVRGGGEHAGSARVELVTVLFDAARDSEARAELALLAADAALDTGSCARTADLLHSRGERSDALAWYDRFLSLLTAERLAAEAAQDLRSLFDTPPCAAVVGSVRNSAYPPTRPMRWCPAGRGLDRVRSRTTRPNDHRRHGGW